LQRLPYFDIVKLPVLKWFVYNMVTGTSTVKLNWLEKVELTTFEKTELMTMLAALSQNQQHTGTENEELANPLNNQDYREQFARVFGLNNI